MNSTNRMPLYNKVSLRPFIFLSQSIGFSTTLICLMFVPQIAMLFVTKSYNALAVIETALLASFTASLPAKLLCRKTNVILPNIAQGLIAGMLFPQDFPLVSVYFIILITFMISNYAFNSYDKTWGNTAAIAVAVAYLCGSQYFPTFLLTDKNSIMQNVVQMIYEDGTVTQLGYDNAITDFLNAHLFRFLGANIPNGYVALFWDNGSLIPAFRFNLLTLLSSAILLCTNIIKPLIPALFLVVYLVLVRVIGPLFIGGGLFTGDILIAMLTGGTLFCAVFLIQWYATLPLTLWGKVLYGLLCGVVAFFILGCGTTPSGAVFTVVLMNIISCILQTIEMNFVTKRVHTKLLAKLKAL